MFMALSYETSSVWLTEWLPESKQQFERQNVYGKDNVKNNSGKMCCKGMDWVYLNDGRYADVGRDSSITIATGYGLDGPGIESR
jgi:hypothetical protein